MFHRLLIEDWQRALSILSLTLFLAVFIVHTIRIRRIPPETIARLENLPLDSDEHA